MIMRRLAAVMLVCVASAGFVACSDPTSTHDGAVTDVSELGPEVARLHNEVARLQQEVHELRQQLATVVTTTTAPLR